MVGFGEGVFGVVGEGGFRSFCETAEGLEVTLSDVESSVEEGVVEMEEEVEIDVLGVGHLIEERADGVALGIGLY